MPSSACRPRSLLVLASSSVALAAPIARAAPSNDTPTTVAYVAPPDCPSDAEFIAMLAQRGVEPQPSTTAGAGDFTIEVTQSHDKYVGRFRANTADRPPQLREVVSSTCSEVVEALAIVTAIAARSTQTVNLAQAPAESTPEPGEPAAPVPDDIRSPEPAAPTEEAKPEEHFRYIAGGRPDWFQPGELHHETRVPEGKVSVDFKLAIDTQVGASFGLLPGVTVPRYDLATRNVIFLTTPGEDPFLLGIVPRIRLSFFGPATKVTDGVTSELLGFQFAMGSCLTPYYDERGFVLLGCAEYGGSAMEVRSTDGVRDWDQPVGSGVVAVTLEAEYNFDSWVHLALRTGWEVRVQGDHAVRASDDATLFELGGSPLFVTAGVGVHF